jgi:hypothetical protein
MNHRLKAEVSNDIDENDGTIRLGKKTREKIVSGLNTHLEIWNNPFANSHLFKVKQAFSKDLARLTKDSREVVFVSKNVYNRHVDGDGYINLSTKKTTCIGSDPEFAIFVKSETGNDILMHAADILAFEADIGSDGPLGELRANPGLTPEEHVNNLGELVGNIYSKLDPNEYKCRIFPYMRSNWTHLNDYNNKIISERDTILTCGGHIHFGLTQKIKNGGYIYPVIVNIIDRLIAICMHRVDMDMSSKRIDDGGYGYLADYKDKSLSLEYRGLSGTWLLYKDLATIVLSVTNSLVENITARINSCFNDINNKDWSVEEGCSLSGNSPVTMIEELVKELCPEIIPIIEKYPFCDFENIFVQDPNSPNTFEYINKSLECLDSIVDVSELGLFYNLVTANYNKYKNLDPNFIENWGGGVSVFDHLNK